MCFSVLFSFDFVDADSLNLFQHKTPELCMLIVVFVYAEVWLLNHVGYSFWGVCSFHFGFAFHFSSLLYSLL